MTSPLPWIGLGTLALGIAASMSSASPQASLTLEEGRVFEVNAFFGSPSSPFLVPIRICAERVVAIFPEFREGEEGRGHQGRTRILVWTSPTTFEGFWVAPSVDVMKGMVSNDPSAFLAVHVPTGATIHRGMESQEDTTEVVLVHLQRSNLEGLGLSSLVRFRHQNTRPMAALYCKGRIVLDLHESFESMKARLQGSVPLV